MGRIERFEDIDSWKSARQIVGLIYDLTSKERFGKDFALCNQMRRASVSILSNIAECFERDGNKEFVNFLSIAKGSCGEVRAQHKVALDQSYIDEKQFADISARLIETSRLIFGLMKYLQQSEIKGQKFR